MSDIIVVGYTYQSEVWYLLFPITVSGYMEVICNKRIRLNVYFLSVVWCYKWITWNLKEASHVLRCTLFPKFGVMSPAEWIGNIAGDVQCSCCQVCVWCSCALVHGLAHPTPAPGPNPQSPPTALHPVYWGLHRWGSNRRLLTTGEVTIGWVGPKKC